MIRLTDVEKVYSTRQGPRQVLHDISLTIEKGQKVGILGRNGAGKSTLIRLISGAELPTSGFVERGISVSWPLAFSGGFQGSLTGLDNLRFICRVYGADIETAIPFVEDFAELGDYFREPVKKYSNGMRARLAFALSMAIEFDCYLIDEVFAVGDERFHKRCRYELFEKRKDRAMIIVSHSLQKDVGSQCDTIFVLHQGGIKKFNDIKQAHEYYSNQN